MLISSGLTKNHWYMAARYATYIANKISICPQKAHHMARILQGEAKHPYRLSSVWGPVVHPPYTTKGPEDRPFLWTTKPNRPLNIPGQRHYAWKRETHHCDVYTKWNDTLLAQRWDESMCGHYSIETKIWNLKFRNSDSALGDDKRNLGFRIRRTQFPHVSSVASARIAKKQARQHQNKQSTTKSMPMETQTKQKHKTQEKTQEGYYEL